MSDKYSLGFNGFALFMANAFVWFYGYALYYQIKFCIVQHWLTGLICYCCLSVLWYIAVYLHIVADILYWKALGDYPQMKNLKPN